MDMDDGEWKLICSTSAQSRDLIIPMMLESGSYIVMIQAEWKTEDFYDLNFGWTGYKRFFAIERERMAEKPWMFNDMIIQRAFDLGKFSPVDAKSILEWMRVYFTDARLWVDIFRNNSNRTIQVSQTYEGSKNVSCEKVSNEESG